MLKQFILGGLSFLFVQFTSGQDLSYFRKDLSFTEIANLPDSSWHPMGEQLYQGHRNGIYWIKMEGIKLKEPFIIHLSESHVTHAQLFFSTGDSIQSLNGSRKINFQVNHFDQISPIYLKVDFQKEAILSLRILPVNVHYQMEGHTSTLLGAYYGTVVLVILINLFSFFNFRRKTYLHYVIMLSFISLGLATSDGYLRLFFNSEFLEIYAEPFFNLGVSLSLPVLANSYMDLKKYLPRVNWIGWFLGSVTVVLFVIYVISGDFRVFAWAEVSALVLVTSYWFAGALIFKKNLAARVFTIAYFIICFSCYDFYIARSFGFSFVGLTLDQFRIGAIIEMLVFTYAISYQGKQLVIENQKMREQLKKFFQGKEGRMLLQQDKRTKLLLEYNLTLREIEILEFICQGKLNKEIAGELFVSINTVKYHIKKIYEKLETSSRQEARQKFFSVI